MTTRLTIAFTALLLVAAACTDSDSVDTTSTTTTSTTTTSTTTTVAPTTSSTSSSTTSEPPTTTTTEPEETTTTTHSDTGETTTTVRVPLTTTTTTSPPEGSDPDLIPLAGLFRQPTAFNGFLDFQATGVIQAGTSIDNLDITGQWDVVDGQFVFTDFDFGVGCNGAEGRYDFERGLGGGRRILLDEDPCQDRVDFITQPGSTCLCFLYNKVELAG